MMTSSINPVAGAYPADIKGLDGFFDIDKAVVPTPPLELPTDSSRESAPPASQGFGFAARLLRSTIFPSNFHSSMIGRLILQTFAGVDINFQKNAETKDLFKRLGATIEKIKTADDQMIEVMRFTGEAFRETVKSRGGTFSTKQVTLQEGNPFYYYTGKGSTHTLTTISTTDQLLKDDLIAMGWREITVDGLRCVQFSLQCGTNPLPPSETKEVIVRFHPNVHYYVTEPEYLINHLAIGKDVVFFDSRGLSETTFPPTEEGFYLDGDAVYKQVRDVWGYSPDKIWLGARCSGTTQVINIRKTYQDDPFHMVLEDPFERWSALIERQAWPLNQLGLSAMESLRSQDGATLSRASEAGFSSDLFDNMAKLRSISKPLTGSRAVIISTDTDRIIGTEAAPEVAKAVARLMETRHLKFNGPPGTDGHFKDVFLEERNGDEVFAAYSRMITNPQAQYLSNFRRS